MKKLTIIVLIQFCLSSLSIATASTSLFESFKKMTAFDYPHLVYNCEDGQCFKVDSVTCVFERYYACSFFSEINGERKLYVTMDGANSFIDALYDAGASIDEEYDSISLKNLECKKKENDEKCTLSNY